MRLTCLSLILALSACGGDTGTTATTATTDTGTTQDTAEPSTGGPGTTAVDPTTGGNSGTATATGETTAEPTTAGPSTDTTAPPSTDTTDPSGTTDATTTDASTGTTDASTTAVDSTDTSTTDDSTTGGVMGCAFEGTQLDATLVHNNNQPPPPCGLIEFKGQNSGMNPGPVYNLDGCECNFDCFAPDPWTFTLDVPPDALPLQMPVCPRIVMERTMSKNGCELVGLAIWETENNAIPVPWYIAGSLLGPIAAVQNDLTLEQQNVEVCNDCPGCCNDGERYDLKFSALGDTVTLPENSVGTLDKPGDDFHYNVTNYQSHLTGICDHSPQVDWIVSLELDP